MDITQLLRNIQNPDARIRNPAADTLMRYEAERFAEFLGTLVGELSNEHNELVVRVAAALQIKRMLTGQNEFSQRKKLELWQGQLSLENRNFTKVALLTALATAPNYVSKQAAQCIEAIAKLELPDRGWPELPSQLIQAFDQAVARDKKEIVGPLVALGYFANVSATIGLDVSEELTNQILTKIIVGLNLDVPGEIQAAAMTALENTLDFARHNMENSNERGVIMERIFAISSSPDSDARIKAFQCLGTVLTLYYVMLQPHMQEIYTRTFEAIRASAVDEGAAKQALNIWDELAEEESVRQHEEKEAAPNALPESERSLRFVDTVREPLTKLVVEYCLLQQEETPDENEITDDNLYGAAEHCLVSLCSCLQADIIPYLRDFIQSNIHSQDWRQRQAAIFAFGALVRENEAQSLGSFFPGIYQSVLRRIVPMDPSHAGQVQQQGNFSGVGEPVLTVRETACWAVGGVCSKPHIVSKQELMGDTLIGLVQTLRDKPRVAHQAATSIFAFANSFQDQAATNIFAQGDGKIVLEISEALWAAATRLDASEWQLMEDAYEALIKIIEVSGAPTMNFIGNGILKHALIRLEQIHSGKLEDRTGFQEVELCDVVLSCLMKLDVTIYALVDGGKPSNPDALTDNIVECMINILNKSDSTAHSNAFAVIGELTRLGETKFKRYQQYVMPLVASAMQSRANSATCMNATRCCSDICNALADDLVSLSLVEGIMSCVYENLRSEDVQKDVKSVTLSLMGDMCSAIPWANFQPHFSSCMKIALSAADIALDITDDEFSEYLNRLRECAIGAIEQMVLAAGPSETEEFLGPIYGLASQISLEISDPRNYYMNKPSEIVPKDLELLNLRYSVSDDVVKSLLGILGDVANKVGERFSVEARKTNAFHSLIQRGSKSADPSLAENTSYACSKLGISL